jgi:hypothetical protein
MQKLNVTALTRTLRSCLEYDMATEILIVSN